MATPAARLVAVQSLLVLGGAVVLGRSFQLQVVQHSRWEARAKALRTESDTIDARRGTIFDRNGVPLAETQEAYRITLAKNEFTDSARIVKQLLRLPGFSAERVAKAMAKRYPNFYDELSAEEIAPLRDLKGCTSTSCGAVSTRWSNWPGRCSGGSTTRVGPRVASNACSTPS